MKITQRIMDDLRYLLDCDDAEIARRSGFAHATIRNASTGRCNTGIETVRLIVERCGFRIRIDVEQQLQGKGNAE